MIEFFIVPLIAEKNRRNLLNSLTRINFSSDSGVTLRMISINEAFSVFYWNVINFYCFVKVMVGSSTDSCIVLQLHT